MKHSIKRQFAFIFIGLMAGTILLCWFLNNTFLGRYYVKEKQKTMLEAYHTLTKAAVSGSFSSYEFTIELQQIRDRYNIEVLVIDSASRTIKSTINDPDFIRKQLYDNIFSTEEEARESRENPLVKTEDYEMNFAVDGRTRAEFLEMWGILDDGNFFIARTALESIRDSVSVANRFLAYVGLIALTASGLIIWFVSRKVTEPIMELAQISERMAHLDFEARYHGNSRNETAILGDNINRLAAALETTISELKTANNKLRLDIEKKIEIDEMRKEFLSNVSHELKTPIALIQGYAEGLKEGVNEDPESREFYCEVIMDEASRMNAMVKKLLTLNQLESGNDAVIMERFDLADLICNYIQSAEILARQNGITVKMEMYDPIYVWGDEFKIEEVIMNYFTNAINHAKNERIIEIKLLKRDGKVRVSVFNSGEPIDEEAIPHLWEKFYKIDKARTREYGGSGVGLSIVKAIMVSLNQDYGVNNYDNGVEFWFELETVVE